MTIFRSPLFKIPFFAFTLIATVATSAPGWGVEARTPDESVTVAKAKTFDARLATTSTQATRLTAKVTLSGLAPNAAGKLRITTGCSTTSEVTYDQLETGLWVPASRPSYIAPSSTIDVYVGNCTPASDTITLRVENLGPEAITFVWNTVVTAGGDGDDTPAGATVNVTKAP
jgi:hypothetical protein